MRDRISCGDDQPKTGSMACPKDFQELFQQLDNMQRGRANQQLGNLNRIGNEDAAAALKAISEARAAVKALIAKQPEIPASSDFIHLP